VCSRKGNLFGVGHDHDHSHSVGADTDRRWLRVGLALILGFMLVEVAVGVAARSLALISDAAHMLTDAVSIVLALLAVNLAKRPAKGTYTYGFKRAEILSAQANGLTLLLLAAWLTYEAIRRLISPTDVVGWPVVLTALAGIGVNVLAAWSISRANRASLNIQGAYQHILNDLYGFIATAIAGVIIIVTGFNRADAIASLVVVALMVRAGLGLLRDSARIFLEAAPAGVHPDRVADRLLAQPSIVEVHDLHVWVITSNQPALSAHVLVEPSADCHAARVGLEKLLADEFQVTHTTLQVDHAGERYLQINASPVRPRC